MGNFDFFQGFVGKKYILFIYSSTVHTIVERNAIVCY